MQPHEANLSRPDVGGPGLQTFGSVMLPERLVVSRLPLLADRLRDGRHRVLGSCLALLRPVTRNGTCQNPRSPHSRPGSEPCADARLARSTAFRLAARACVPDETTGLRLIAACQHRSRCMARAARIRTYLPAILLPDRRHRGRGRRVRRCSHKLRPAGPAAGRDGSAHHLTGRLVRGTSPAPRPDLLPLRDGPPPRHSLVPRTHLPCSDRHGHDGLRGYRTGRPGTRARG